MFAIKVKDKFLAIPDMQTFTLVKNSELFSTDLPEGEYSYPINLSLKDANVSEFFSGLRSIQSVKEFKSVDCQLYFRNRPIENNARLIFRKRRGAVIQGYVLTGSSIFAQALKNTAINEIDYGGFDTGEGHQDMVNHMRQTALFPNNYNHIFAPIHAPNFKEDNSDTELYNGIINLWRNNVFLANNTLGSEIHLTSYVPFLKLHFVLKKILAHFGFSIEWNLLETADFKKIYLVNNSELSEYFEKVGCVVLGENQSYSSTGVTSITNIYEEAGEGIKVERLALPTPFIEFQEDLSGDEFNETLSFNFADNSLTIGSDNRDYTISFETNFTYFRWDANDVFIFEVWMETDTPGEFEPVWAKQYTFVQVQDKITISDDLILNIPDGSIGKKLKFKAVPSWFVTSNIDYVQLSGEVWRPLDTEFLDFKVTIIEPPRVEVKNLIEYHQHLSDDNCSDFLNAIRKRFGAYVSNIDFEKKNIVFSQINDIVSKKNSKPLFKNRSIVDEMEINFNKYVFENVYKDEPLIEIGDIPSLNEITFEVGSSDEDAEINTIALDYPPILENVLKIPIVGFKGKMANSNPSELRLALYHGIVDSVLGGNPSPFITAGHTDRQNNDVCSFNLRLSGNKSLWEIFWKKWYEKLFLKEKYTFEIYPDAQEMKDFKFDKIDFYEFAEFVAEKVEFKLRGNKILSSKFDCVKVK